MKASKYSIDRRSFIARSSLCLASITASFPVLCALDYPLKKKKNKLIPTITGEVAFNRLGTTLMHEHILWFGGPGLEDPHFNPIPDHLISDTIDFAVSLLNEAARVGIETIVDLTPHRPINLYEQIAKRTPVNIIVSTGFYRRLKSPKWKADMEDEKQMEASMLKELTDGIDGTKIRAGIIKIAQEGGRLSDWERKVFLAAARANKATDIPIATHTGSAFEQFDFLVRNGANPHKILLSHVDVGRKGIPGDLMTIVKEGGYLEVDTFGQEFYTPWSELVALLRTICDAGYTNKIVIDIDSNWHWESGKKIFEGSGPPNFDPNAANRTYAYMITDAVPRLLKSGFSMKEITTFLVNNPSDFFSNNDV